MHVAQRPSHREVLVRFAVGLVLWACSAYFTVSLFLAMAGQNRVSEVFMTILALELEGTKILTWRMGGRARYLAWALLSLSIVASLGAALRTVKEAESSFHAASTDGIKTSRIYEELATDEATIDREIALDLDRLMELPPEYTTAAAHLSLRVAALRDRRAAVAQQLASLETHARSAYDEGNLFVLLGKELGLSPETVLLVILLFLSLCIEVGALVLTSPSLEVGHGPTGQDQAHASSLPGRTSQDCPDHAEAFLVAAMDGADLPYLHGRDTTARKLGISSYEAKRLVRTLCTQGRIIAQGKRLRLATTKPEELVKGRTPIGP